ncbi:site-specific integrase [Paenibacillus thiaminolyticus]|uniref:tyrosine-type recombinase/integrase n=1 Tax=Paenibacillus thiaminolyticus TaxID=49283 RepID=UPI003D2CE23A
MAKGSIEQRGKNSWRLTVDLGTLPNGKRNRPRKTITVEDKALLRTTKRLQDHLDDQLALFKQEVLSGNYIKPGKTLFSVYVDEWREKYAKFELSGNTLNVYNDHIRNHILPRYGNMYIDTIKPMHIVNLLADLRKPGARKDGKEGPLGDRTIQYIYSVMQNLFNIAKTWGFINESPMEDIPNPKAKKPKAKFYETWEVTRIIDALYKEAPNWRLMMLAAIVGGLRRGELVALQWRHIDFMNNCICVQRSISLQRKGKVYEKETKNNEERYVDMPKWYMDELKGFKKAWLSQREEMEDKWRGEENDEYIFHAGYGKPFYYSYPTEWWTKFTKRHQIRYISLHKLRHTSVTVLIEKGASIKSIQERVGHKQAQTTNDTYAHVTRKLSREVANLFDEFDPRNTKNGPQFVPTLTH